MTLHRRNGFALLTTLLAVILVSALIAAAHLQIDESARATRAITLHHRVFANAEAALWKTFVSISPSLLRPAPIGLFSQTLSTVGPLTNKVTVTKIDSSLVWIVSETHLTEGREGVAHRIGLGALLPPDTIESRLTRLPQAAWVDLY
jgi:hypothetical protein